MRLLHTCGYFAYLIAQIVLGSVTVVRLAWGLGVSARPAIIEYPMRARTDLEVSLLASSITITPGTLVLGIAAAEGERAPTMFVHSMFDDDRRSVVAGLAELEDKILLAVRKEGLR